VFEDNKKFSEEMSLTYPLLSDPERSVINAYGVISDRGPFAMRSYFLVGTDGKIKWLTVNKGILPNEEVLEAIKTALQN